MRCAEELHARDRKVKPKPPELVPAGIGDEEDADFWPAETTLERYPDEEPEPALT